MSKRSLALVLSCLLCLSMSSAADRPGRPGGAHPRGPPGSGAVEEFIGAPAEPRPFKTFDVPEHPFMAADGDSNIHNDAYQTDAYDRMGPLGKDMSVTSTFHVAECASVTFDSKGRIVTICVGRGGPSPRDDGPGDPRDPRVPPTSAALRGRNGIGHLHRLLGRRLLLSRHEDRAVIPTNNRQIWVIGFNGTRFEIDRTYDLSGAFRSGTTSYRYFRTGAETTGSSRPKGWSEPSSASLESSPHGSSKGRSTPTRSRWTTRAESSSSPTTLSTVSTRGRTAGRRSRGGRSTTAARGSSRARRARAPELPRPSSASGT